MLEGKTSDCLAIANTAILIRLIEALIERGVITSARRGGQPRKLPELGSQQFRGRYHHHQQGIDAENFASLTIQGGPELWAAIGSLQPIAAHCHQPLAGL
jgi:hypothetical protein